MAVRFHARAAAGYAALRRPRSAISLAILRLALCSLAFLAAFLTCAAESSAGKVIQQMRTPDEAARQKTLKYTYYSTAVGYITYRNIGEGGYFHLTTLTDQVIPIRPDDKVDSAFRAFLSTAEEKNVGVALTGAFLVWTDGSTDFYMDGDTRYEAAPTSYAAARTLHEDAQKKAVDQKRQALQRRTAEANDLKTRKKQESELQKDIDEFEKAIQQHEAKKQQPQPPGQGVLQLPQPPGQKVMQ